MRLRPAGLGVVVVAASGVCAGLALAGTITLGSTATDIGCAPGLVVGNTQVASGSGYVVPAGHWTITSWSMNGGTLAGDVALRIFRPLGGGTYRVLGTDTKTLSAGVTSTFPASIAVQGGDVLGLEAVSLAQCANTTGDSGDLLTSFGSGVVGDTTTAGFPFTGYQADLSVTLSDGASTWVAPPPTAAYCSVSGNTWQDGSAIPPGTFLYLLFDQPRSDPHYKDAVPALFVQGKGITCDPPPAGWTQQGFAGDAQHVPDGLYPYYAPPS